MVPLGYLLVVLNTHHPFVRNPHLEYPVEETWLFDSITESYLPLIETFETLSPNGSFCKGKANGRVA